MVQQRFWYFALFLIGLGLRSAAQQPAEPVAQVARVDLVTQYTYWEPHGSAGGVRFRSLNEGALLSGSYYYNAYLGGEVEAGLYHQTQNDGAFSIAAGPVLRLPFLDLTPFVHALAGASEVTGPNAPTLSQSSYQYNPPNWGFDITAGGGLDYQLPLRGRHVGLRIIQVDYQAVRGLNNPVPGASTRLNLTATRVSMGVKYSFGKITSHSR
jgi:hypothetical protein